MPGFTRMPSPANRSTPRIGSSLLYAVDTVRLNLQLIRDQPKLALAVLKEKI